MAKKISARRAGLLQLMLDEMADRARRGQTNDLICFPSYDWLRLEKYGLNTYDSIHITLACKAGQIEATEHSGIYRITDAGKKALEEFKA